MTRWFKINVWLFDDDIWNIADISKIWSCLPYDHELHVLLIIYQFTSRKNSSGFTHVIKSSSFGYWFDCGCDCCLIVILGLTHWEKNGKFFDVYSKKYAFKDRAS